MRARTDNEGTRSDSIPTPQAKEPALQSEPAIHASPLTALIADDDRATLAILEAAVLECNTRDINTPEVREALDLLEPHIWPEWLIPQFRHHVREPAGGSGVAIQHSTSIKG